MVEQLTNADLGFLVRIKVGGKESKRSMGNPVCGAQRYWLDTAPAAAGLNVRAA